MRKSSENTKFFVTSTPSEPTFTKSRKQVPSNNGDTDSDLTDVSDKSDKIRRKKPPARKRLPISQSPPEKLVQDRPKPFIVNESNDSEEDDAYDTGDKSIGMPLRKIKSGRSSVSRFSSQSERSRQSFSSDQDTDDDGGRETQTNGNEDDSITESSIIQPTSPVRKKTSADLLAEESSQLLLSQGITEG